MESIVLCSRREVRINTTTASVFLESMIVVTGSCSVSILADSLASALVLYCLNKLTHGGPVLDSSQRDIKLYHWHVFR